MNETNTLRDYAQAVGIDYDTLLDSYMPRVKAKSLRTEADIAERKAKQQAKLARRASRKQLFYSQRRRRATDFHKVGLLRSTLNVATTTG